MIRPSRWPLGWLPLLLPAISIALAVFSQTLETFSWPYQVWARTSQLFVSEPLIFAVPLSAAAAAYAAGRLTGPDRITNLASSLRSGAPVVIRQLGSLGCVFTASYVLGMLPLVVLTTLTAHAGGPSPLPVLTGLLSVLTATAVGYFAGVLATTAWIAPLVLVLGFLVIQLNMASQGSFREVIPLTYDGAGVGQVANLPVVGYRLAFLLLVTTVTSLLASRALARSRRWKIPSWSTAGMIVLVLVMSLAPLGTDPRLAKAASEPPRTCRTEAGVRYCVHQAHRPELDELITAAEPVYQAYGNVPAHGEQVWDSALLDGSRAGSTPDDVVSVGIRIRAGRTDSMRSPQRQLAYGLAGSTSCAIRFPEHVQPSMARAVLESRHPADIATELSYWLAGRAEQTSGLRPRTSDIPAFDGVPPQEVRTWIASHERRITECALDSRP
ncbi:hypothetical protein SAMN04487905_114109 [Actinopolyspora xinjiangensis]|uniref:ABC-2 type transport system permease protein n=1 Tax=Actinopolyspora xinjiangensis TaxID=405564 RepID=A0A1H0WT52_9ACTN|nr:hypothetical protein [Actinopolyspora xinjiangensis]SDP93456.1 hypothetical protein SAMN04487905_114109 [Actinopolyspora xinjiangensis]